MKPGYHEAKSKLKAEVLDGLPESRERSLALTKLDEFEQWVNAADAKNVFEEIGVKRDAEPQRSSA